MNALKILGIETSCDETAVAIVEDGVNVISSVIASQIDLHAKTGGVVPEVAAREHVLKIIPVIDEALKKGNLDFHDIDAIAVTQGPGLLSSLIIGYTAALTLSKSLNLPIIPVNHIAGHIYSNWLDLNSIDEVEYPVLVLTVSGGHNDLVLLESPLEFKLIGETLDDAAGEAFDKTARILGLGYPGGPAISKAAENGNPHAYAFPRAMLNSGDFNFSFSGLKTAVLQTVEKFENNLNQQKINDIAASFQECVCEILIGKLRKATEKYNVNEVHLAGGVSANSRLREMLQEKMPNKKFRYTNKLSYCTDNAAMIAGVAYQYHMKNPDSYSKNTEAKPDPQLEPYQNQI
ncbi:tRNA (adenosine(37)-N6)-threonylcarbamoyltransferase complex transferase subunit TsaD [Candidatus Peregrinibacteria bacterium]|nr:tRNA (adenosine(37)-N6)-threonylcarbamoyltransferase complex transferase subunit TsaD [Candidatus Peregrinibacteria bacterium]